MGIAHHVRDARKRGEFLRGPLRVAARRDDAGRGITGVYFADGIAGLGICGCCNRARIHHNDVRLGTIGNGHAAAIPKLSFNSSGVGLGGATAELFDVEGDRH